MDISICLLESPTNTRWIQSRGHKRLYFENDGTIDRNPTSTNQPCWMTPWQRQLNAHIKRLVVGHHENHTRVVEHPIIDTDPHLGMSLALLFTHTSNLLNPVLTFVLFQAVNQHESEILADRLVCNISSANFHQNSIGLGLRLTLFRC